MSTLACINLVCLIELNGDIKVVTIREPKVVNRGENQTKKVKSECSPISPTSESSGMIAKNKFLGMTPGLFNYYHQGGAQEICICNNSPNDSDAH